jgi:hypothetical protein
LSDVTDKALDKVHEVQFDVIGRIVPGAVVLGVCLQSQLSLKLEWSHVLGGVIPAYLLGFGVEYLSLLLIETWMPQFVRFIQRKNGIEDLKTEKWFRRLSYALFYDFDPNDTLWERCNSGNCRFEQRPFKMLAELTLFRSMILISVCSLVSPPPIASWVPLLSGTTVNNLESHSSPPWITTDRFLVGFVFLLACFAYFKCLQHATGTSKMVLSPSDK